MPLKRKLQRWIKLRTNSTHWRIHWYQRARMTCFRSILSKRSRIKWWSPNTELRGLRKVLMAKKTQLLVWVSVVEVSIWKTIKIKRIMASKSHLWLMLWSNASLRMPWTRRERGIKEKKRTTIWMVWLRRVWLLLYQRPNHLSEVLWYSMIKCPRNQPCKL